MIEFKNTRPNETAQEVMTIEEAANFLGVSVSLLRKHINDLPHRRLGDRVLFGRRALLYWLNRPKQRPRKAFYYRNRPMTEQDFIDKNNICEVILAPNESDAQDD